jgi:putative acetyltransferase
LATSKDEPEFRLRPGIEADAEGMSRVHFGAVRVTAAPFYPSDVIESWSRQPDETRHQQFRDAIAKGDEMFVVSYNASEMAGFGSLAPASAEIRGVYVDPRFDRRGIGSSILRELERMAAQRGIQGLHLDASVNAESFYARHGYEAVARGTHTLGRGTPMASVRMRKSLNSRSLP